jgi:hypothetical protein
MRLFDRYWALVLLALGPAFAVLNLEHQQMQGIYDDYLCHRQTMVRHLETCVPDFPDLGRGIATRPQPGAKWCCS